MRHPSLTRSAHGRRIAGFVAAGVLLAPTACDRGGAAGAPETDDALVADSVASPGDAAEGDAAAGVGPALDASPDADATLEIDPGPLFPPDLAATLRETIDAHLEATDAPGASVAVYLPGHGTWTGATGLASLDPERPAEPDDRYRIGSITKTFVAAAVLRLAEAGVLSLDDPVDDWVPGFDLGRATSLETLLTHTSGIFNYTDDYRFLELAQDFAPPEEVIAFALDHPPVFEEPGSAYAYSNTGYFLLGLVVEAATDAILIDHLRAELLAPRGLDDTFMDGVEPIDGGMVDGYVLGTEVEEGVGDFDMSWAWAAGAMVSDVDDLCRWARALLRQDVLPPDLREAMIGPAELTDGTETAYGYGLQHQSRSGRRVVGHTGSTMGFNSDLFFHLDTGVCVAVLSNDFLGDPRAIAHPTWGAVFDWLDAR